MKHIFLGRDPRNSVLIPALLLLVASGCLKKSMDSTRSAEESAMTSKLGALIATPSDAALPSPPAETNENSKPLEGKPIANIPVAPATAVPPPMTDYVLGGDGPGSCGLPADAANTCRAGKTAVACPAGYTPIASLGDCYVTPGYGPQCFGNRPLCAKTGTDVRPVIGFHLFLAGACPADWEPMSANAGLARGHIYGIVTGPHTNVANYTEAVWCKQTKNLADLLPSDKVLKNLGIMGIAQHTAAAPACPEGHEDAGGIPDCSNFTRDPKFQWCSGLIRVCKALAAP